VGSGLLPLRKLENLGLTPVLDWAGFVAQRYRVVADDEQATTSGRKLALRVETALGVAGVLLAAGFFLPWFALGGDEGSASGLALARRGGWWMGLAAIPALGGLTAVFGFLGWRLCRYVGVLAGIATLVPAVQALVTQMPLLYVIPVAVGVTVVALGMLERGLVVAAPLGLLLLAGSAGGVLLSDDEPVFALGETVSSKVKAPAQPKPEAESEPKPDAPAESSHSSVIPPAAGLGVVKGLGVMPMLPLAVLLLLVPIAGVWLTWAGLRKKGQPRPCVFAGWLLVAFAGYVAALEVFAAELHGAGVGFWMTALGGLGLLLASRPLATRTSNRRAKQAKKEEPTTGEKHEKGDESEKQQKPDKQSDGTGADEAAGQPARSAAKPQEGDAAAAARAAKIEKLALLKKAAVIELARRRDAAKREQKSAADVAEAPSPKAAAVKAPAAKATVEKAPAAQPAAAPSAKKARSAGPATAEKPGLSDEAAEAALAASAARGDPEDPDYDPLEEPGIVKPAPASDVDLEAMLADLKKRTRDEED